MTLPTYGQINGFQGTVIGRITSASIQDRSRRRDYVLASLDLSEDVSGYAGVVTGALLDQATLDQSRRMGIPVVHGLKKLDALAEGIIVAADGRTGLVRILFNPNSADNFLFVTGRCNSRCLMCSQPPRDVDDTHRLAEHLRVVDLIDESTSYLGITGGEPTLLDEGFFQILRACRDRLPGTHVHVLTNGRMFYYEAFAERLGRIGHPLLSLGVPLYSDRPREHDYIVQAPGAFLQTTVGFYNLFRQQQTLEVRVVLHALTYRRLLELARFIYRVFPFVSHVAFMGLEPIGYTRTNLAELWIDPWDYQDELEGAVNYLANRGVPVSIYNQQLCVLRESLWEFARKSISEWKRVYLPECTSCTARADCGGFFASGMSQHSDHIKPLSCGGSVFVGKGPRVLKIGCTAIG